MYIHTFDTCSFHNKLKTNPRYLNHNVNRRCDDLIEVLLLVEVDMFYERKRKELLTSTTEASRKVEGDRHTRGQSIADSKVHVQVICYLKNVDLHECVCTITLSNVIQEEGDRYLVDSSDSKAQYSVEILSSTVWQTVCHTVWKRSAFTCADTWSCAPAMISSMVICVNTPTRCSTFTCSSNLWMMMEVTLIQSQIPLIYLHPWRLVLLPPRQHKMKQV